MRTLFVLPILSLCFATPVAAQDVTVKTLTNVSAVGISSGLKGINTKPANTVATTSTGYISQAIQALDRTRGSKGTTQINATAYAERKIFQTNKPVQARIFNMITLQGDGAGFITSDTVASTATAKPVSYLVTFNADKSVHGVVNLTYTGWIKYSAAKGITSVDVGNDSKVDWTGDLSKSTSDTAQFKVSFANGPVVIKVTTEASSPTTQNSSQAQAMYQSVTLQLKKTGSCTLTNYGTSCGGASLLAGVMTLGSQSIVATKLTGGVKGGFLARVIGGKRFTAPLPGGCTLLAEPLFVDLYQADANGEFREVFPMPAETNFTVTFQYIPIDLDAKGIKALATNAFELTCSGF
ncbi:MAG: hypothetical protein ACYTFN_00595 [Planctomycetota bacterium]